jgi:hypothetical protein
VNRTTRHRIAVPSLLIGVLAAASACGDRTSDPGDSTHDAAPGAHRSGAATGTRTATTDPCTLLPAATLQRLMGESLRQQGPAEERAQGQECAWSFHDPHDLTAGTLTITAWHGREFFSPGSIGRPLAGLGEEAQLDPTLGIVLLRVGDEVLQAHVLSPTARDRATAVARALADAI